MLQLCCGRCGCVAEDVIVLQRVWLCYRGCGCVADGVVVLQMVHVTVNARTEDDIDEEDIMKKVSNASGANYSFHKEKARAVEAPTPVVSQWSCLHRVFVILWWSCPHSPQCVCDPVVSQ